MIEPSWENDPENPDFWDNPVTEREFHGTLSLFRMDHFARYIPKDVLSELAKAGIVLRRKDNLELQAALKTFHQGPSVHYSSESLAREERIASLAKQLKNELEPDMAGEDEPYREFWGDDVDPDDPEPSEYLDLKEFCGSLDLLERSAVEKAEWLISARGMDVEPKSNRADRIRYFYWLILLGFWKYSLGKEIRTSTNGDNEADGPLVRFLQIMSKGADVEFNEINRSAVRSWIQRNKDKVETVKQYFAHGR